MTLEEYYGSKLPAMLYTKQYLLNIISRYPQTDQKELKPIIYCCSRIKSPESMIRKLSARGLPQDGMSASTKIYDAVGVRIVCTFAEDVYKIADWLKNHPDIIIEKEKDYIAYPKENGYRSYHLKVRLRANNTCAEIQIRTIATDFWATLEHQLKYKKDIPHKELIRSELKRCADEIASVDLSMQTIRDIIRTSISEENNRSI